MVRNTEPGIEGTLRKATESESTAFGPSKGSKADTEQTIQARVLAAVTRNRGLRSASQIVERTAGKRADAFAAIKMLRGDGRLVLGETGFEAVPVTENENL
ncbi:MAG TPA: hypothetical protein VH062_08025 [Polyangiaceae bacterium]|nr:hypothetical protein [Polyangiaceae bacterium]